VTRRLRPPEPAEPWWQRIPAELRTFAAEDWPDVDQDEEGAAYASWRTARHEWFRVNGGSPIELLRHDVWMASRGRFGAQLGEPFPLAGTEADQ